MSKKLLHILMILLAVSPAALAQKRQIARDTAIRGATIEITQSYKPEVKQAAKPELSTNLPPADNSRPVFNYNISQQNLQYNYTATPLRPLALGKDSSVAPFPNYVKLGGGTLSTVYLDAGISSLKGDNYETSIHVHHLSQAGKIAEQKSSLSGLEATGTLYGNKHDIHAGLDASYNTFYYYGFDHSLYTFPAASVKQSFTGVTVFADIKNKDLLAGHITYNPLVKIATYSDHYKTSELTEEVKLPFVYNVDSAFKIHLALNGSFTQYNPNAFTAQNNNVLQLSPGLAYSAGDMNIYAGISPTFGNNGKSYILPDIHASYVLSKGQFIFTAGWKGDIAKNTYNELSTRNPYMMSNYLQAQTQSTKVFGNIQTKLGNHISLYGGVSWWNYKALPLFINDTAGDAKQFVVVYDNATNLSLQAAIRYQVANSFYIGMSIIKNNYNTSAFKHAWHEPGTIFKIDVQARPLAALTINGYISIMDEIYAVNKANVSVSLNNIMDIGASAEYNITKRFSAFVQVTNLLNSHYERWMGYQAYGINLYGGLRLKF